MESPRIRFNHRGQVALALPLDQDNIDYSNDFADIHRLERQFFITLDEAPFIDSKHVIFGTIGGATIFNAIRIGKTEVKAGEGEDEDSSSLPVDMDNAPTIKAVKIDFHPFEHLVCTPEDQVPWKKTKAMAKEGRGGDADEGSNGELKKRRKKRKGKKDLNVLSFGEEMMEDEGGLGATGIGSSHDILLSGKKKKLGDVKLDEGHGDDDINKRSKRKRNKEKEIISTGYSKKRKEEMSKNHETSSRDVPEEEIDQNKQDTVAETKKDSLNKKEKEREKSQKSSHHFQPESITVVEKNKDKESNKDKKMSALEARRAEYFAKRKGGSTTNSFTAQSRGSKKRDEYTMAKLLDFKSKMIEAKTGGSKNSNKNRNGSGDQVAVDDNRYDSVSRLDKDKELETDNSLAARMARRSDAEIKLQQEKQNNGIPAVPIYSGQVLEDDNDDYDGDESSSAWLKTKFKCKRHIDHDSKDNVLGGDGRAMDEYEVIDEKDRGGGGERNSGSARYHHKKKSTDDYHRHRESDGSRHNYHRQSGNSHRRHHFRDDGNSHGRRR